MANCGDMMYRSDAETGYIKCVSERPGTKDLAFAVCVFSSVPVFEYFFFLIFGRGSYV